MANRMEINQTGIIVFLRKPTPNSFKEPSGLYTKAGFNILINANNII